MNSIRWKLLLMAVLLVFIPVFFLNRYALRFFDRFTSRALELQLRRYALVAAEEFRALVHDAPPERREEGVLTCRQLFERYQRESGVVLLALDTNLVVRVSSTNAPPAGPDLHERPELAEALRTGMNARHRLTPDRSYMFYYVARPIRDTAGRTIGVAYVYADTGEIIRAIQRMLLNQRVATGVALATAGGASLLLAWTLTRRLRLLARRARAYAAGTGRPDLRLGGRDEIADLSRTLTDMAAEIERRNAYNRDFVATTFHELKTPVTAIRGAAELLESGAQEDADARRRFTEILLHQAGRMEQLIDDLALLTRIDTEVAHGVRERVLYGVFVRTCVARLATAFPAPRAELVVEAPDELPVLVNPVRIEQVLANLLQNAFRYTPADGRVTVRVERRDGVAVTRILDTGTGIDPVNLPRVFDRFFTTEPKTRGRAGGSGLGLAIVKSIVENHRGTVSVESEPGRGAAFTFTLPLA